VAGCALLAVAFAGLRFLAEGWRGLSLADEGYLWYGVQRVLAGEVPIRDFLAYDPGRYYWLAGWMRLGGGTGIVALHAADALTGAGAIFLGCLTMARWGGVARARGWLVLVAAVLWLWLTPGYKMADLGVTIGLIAGLGWLAERPDARGHFLAGLAVGLAAECGRNHALYGLGGSLLLMALTWRERQAVCSLPRAIGAAAGGLTVGYLPVLVMLAFCPGFAASFLESVAQTLARGYTNFPRPIPWPWLARLGPLGPMSFVREVAMGVFFVGLLVFAVGGLGWVARRIRRNRPMSPGLLSCLALGLPYAQYAFSRADIEHLALGIFPALLGTLFLLARGSTAVRWGGGAALAVASVAATFTAQPFWLGHRYHWTDRIAIDGQTVLVDPETAGQVKLLRQLVERYAPRGENFLAMPDWPGAYSLFDRKSPVWEIYAQHSRSVEFQQAEIRRFEAAAPAFVVLHDFALDGLDEHRFVRTHPELDRYLHEHFRIIPMDGLPPGVEVLIPP
jgi:hypothetical protein